MHKKLRSKRLAPILIQEVTRRTHLKGIFQAIYTAGVYLPTPISRCQYYHRSLNPKKLVETKFTSIPRHLTMARMIRHYKLPEVPVLPGVREMEKKDLKQVGRLLRAFLGRMEMAPLLSGKDVEHALFAGRGVDVDGKRVGQVCWTYVVEVKTFPFPLLCIPPSLTAVFCYRHRIPRRRKSPTCSRFTPSLQQQSK